MNTEPYGTTVFCDDIRHEVAGKMTLVGCYLAEMNFSNPAPGTLPTLAALVNIRVPKSIEFRKLSLRVIRETGDKVEELFRADTDVSSEEREQALQSAQEDPTDDRIILVTMPVKWSPMVFTEPCFLKVRGYLDDDHEIRAGALKVNFPSSERTETMDKKADT